MSKKHIAIQWSYGVLSALFALAGGLEVGRADHRSFFAAAHALQPDDIEDDVEDDVEDDIEDDIQSDIEDDLEDEVEADLESDIEEDIESQIEDEIEQDVQEGIEDDIEDDVDDDIRGKIQDGIDDDLDDDFDNDLDDDNFDDDDEIDDDDDRDDDFDSDDDDDLERLSASGEDIFDIGVEDGVEFVADERLVLTDKDGLDALRTEGFDTVSIDELDGIDLFLASVRTRPGLDIDDIEARLEVALPGAAIDYNHIYRADSSDPRAFGGFMPASFFGETGASRGRGAKIGMIDTAVRTDHPALEDTRIETRDFVKSTAQRPEAHGTAVASILVGAADAYQGLAPRAKLYAASVFSKHSASGQITTAASLVRALDWIASERVDVLNMSLSGPANAVLKSAIDAATARGIVIVAASGNDGPAARPVYPAGYDNVIAVTAVDSKSRVYRLAGRGDHVDVAAPGVEIIVAAPDGGYDLQTGTSFAAPFASASIALQCKSPKNCRGALAMETLVDKIVDLGAPGHDPVYGHGLISP